MNRHDWQAIEAAATLLQLGKTATLGEIKRAYHRLSKRHHPDVAQGEPAADGRQMYRLTAAYELLKRHCETFRFPLQAPEGEPEYDPYDPQQWWQARFGQDPIWSDRKTRRR